MLIRPQAFPLSRWCSCVVYLRISSVRSLLYLPAFVCVELYLEPASALMVSPAGVYSLVFVIRPCVLPHAELEAAVLEDRGCLVHGPNIVLSVGNKGVTDAVVDLIDMLLDEFVWFTR